MGGKRAANTVRSCSTFQGLNEEESQAAEPPAKRHKPLSTSKKTAPDLTSQPCDGQRETHLNQENIVSPPMPSTLHTSASPSLLASPLELPSSQHTMVRWGPMSPAFLIRDSPSPPLRGQRRVPPPSGAAQQGRRKRIRPEKTAQLLDALTALIRAGSASESDSKGGEVDGLWASEDVNPPSSVTEKDTNVAVEDEDFHLGGLENDSEMLADLLNVSSVSWDNLPLSRLEESHGNSAEGIASLRDVTQSKTSVHAEPDSTCQEHPVAEDSVAATEDEFWEAAEDYLATQEERGLCSGGPQSHPSSAGCEQELPLEVSQDEFDLLLSQADERHLQVFERETPQRPAQPVRSVRL